MFRKKNKAARGAPHWKPGAPPFATAHHLDSRISVKLNSKSGFDPGPLLAVFANLPDGVAILDDQFHYLSANPAYARAAGVSPPALAGRGHFELFPDPLLEAIFRQVLLSGQAHQAAAEPLVFLQQPGEAACYWDWSLSPFTAEIGGLILLVHKSGEPQAGGGNEDYPPGILHDSEERAEASEAQARASHTQLRLTQLMYQHLFESTSDSNVIVNDAGEIVALNHQAEVLFGYPRAELTGQKVELLLPEVKRELLVVQRAESLNSPAAIAVTAKGALRLEQAARRKDGSSFPTEVTLNPFRVSSSLLVLFVVRDISQRVQREDELRTQSALMELLQDIAVAANEAKTVQSAFYYALERINRHLGWQLGHAFILEEGGVATAAPIWTGFEGPREPSGVSPAASGAHPAERFPLFKAVSDALRFRDGVGLPGAVLNSGQPVWLNDLADNPSFRRQREARLEKLRTGLAVPVMAGKETVGILEFFHDQDVPPDQALLRILPHIGVQLGRVVERTRAEEALRKTAAQLRMIMTSLPVLLWVIDREGKVLLLEGRGVTATTLDPQALLGKNVFETLSTRPDLLLPLRQALDGEEVHTELVSGKDAVFEAFVMPYFDVNWAVDGAIGLAFNISERKRMENELEEMKHRLLDSVDHERARLASQLHDGPLQDLFGAYYQIQEIKNSLDEGSQETADNALKTIHGVSATLRVICGELHPNTLIHLGLEKAIRSHAERAQERLEGPAVHLELDNDGQSLPHGLRLGMFRVYQQLFNNAARHSGASDIWVRLRLEAEQVRLEVQDNGRGFENPGHWIELVRQGKLGLASALERVEGLGGKLEVETQPGQGTLARVIAPKGTF